MFRFVPPKIPRIIKEDEDRIVKTITDVYVRLRRNEELAIDKLNELEKDIWYLLWNEDLLCKSTGEYRELILNINREIKIMNATNYKDEDTLDMLKILVGMVVDSTNDYKEEV